MYQETLCPLMNLSNLWNHVGEVMTSHYLNDHFKTQALSLRSPRTGNSLSRIRRRATTCHGSIPDSIRCLDLRITTIFWGAIRIVGKGPKPILIDPQENRASRDCQTSAPKPPITLSTSRYSRTFK